MIYTVISGDTLSRIAKNNDMSLNDLLEMNPQIINPDRIKVGQKIRLTRGNDEEYGEDEGEEEYVEEDEEDEEEYEEYEEEEE